jgi:hypothetical protein
MRRDEPALDGKANEVATSRNRALCLLRAFSFLLLDAAAAQTKGRPLKSCIRLMKVALKAARMCIEGIELSNATKVLERAAEYQDVLSKQTDGTGNEESEVARRLRMEYFAVRTTLVSDMHCTPRLSNTKISLTRALLGVASRAHGHGRAHVRKVQATHGRSYCQLGRDPLRPPVRNRQRQYDEA